MDRMTLFRSGVIAEAALTGIPPVGSAVFQSLNESGKINLCLAIDYVVCSADGIASRGLIHMAAAALDLVKSGMQMSVFMLIKSSRVLIMPLPDPVNWHLAIDKIYLTKIHNFYYCLDVLGGYSHFKNTINSYLPNVKISWLHAYAKDFGHYPPISQSSVDVKVICFTQLEWLCCFSCCRGVEASLTVFPTRFQ
ncbi:hypothetical protein ZIOFF_029864 [Zingiber officinale]|uniref:Uncharacterized protein n=1 Tax=Zingiber officinale TaxID=94328 RepID=A0A8J5GNE6_ZINOF|nr:hypothetical protein ZIOFF_029864 [Zingiber officinale]